MAHSAPLPNIMESVQGVHYPADASTLLKTAQENGAAPSMLRLIERLPDRQYRNVSEVNHALGEIEDMPDAGMKFWAHGASQELEDEAKAKKH
jgi:hypothetical protein